MEKIIIYFLVFGGVFVLIRAISKRKGYDISRTPIPRRYWLTSIFIVIAIISLLGVIAYFHDRNLKLPSVEIISPIGGEEWEIGETYPIKWQSTGIDKVNISIINYSCYGRNSTTTIVNILPSEVVRTAEICREHIINGFSAKEGIYNWSIPANVFAASSAWQSGDDFQIFIIGLDEKGQIEDEKNSPDNFKIFALSTSPSERETAYWKVYRNDTYGFETKYPQDWDVQTGFRIGVNNPYFIFFPQNQSGGGVVIDIVLSRPDCSNFKMVSAENVSEFLKQNSAKDEIEFCKPGNYFRLYTSDQKDIYNQILSTFKFLE